MNTIKPTDKRLKGNIRKLTKQEANNKEKRIQDAILDLESKGHYNWIVSDGEVLITDSYGFLPGDDDYMTQGIDL